jgi:prepilin-type N-terminal cleavage/methylation domain-containing protein
MRTPTNQSCRTDFQSVRQNNTDGLEIRPTGTWPSVLPLLSTDYCLLSTPPHRRAFTLVEMLVVLTLIIILASIAVAFVPRTNQRSKTSQAASSLQGWLLIAKQWAKRDQVPTGLRIFPGMTYPNTIAPNSAYRTDVQYIQQPPDYTARIPSQVGAGVGGYLNTVVTTSPLGTTHVMISAPSAVGGQQPVPVPGAVIDLFGGFTSAAPSSSWLVQPGDYLEINGGGPLYGISKVVNSGGLPGGPGDTLVLTSPISIPSGANVNVSYRVIRQPRILPGEPSLLLPQDTAIDTGASFPTRPDVAVPPPLPTPIDILFNPSGTVSLTGGTASGNVVLWVRDVTQDGFVDDQALITVYARSGTIAAYPVDTSTTTTLAANALKSLALGVPSPLTLQSAVGVQSGTYLLIDAGAATQEVVFVSDTPNGNQVNVFAAGTNHGLFNHHNARGSVLVNPYSFALQAATGGM